MESGIYITQVAEVDDVQIPVEAFIVAEAQNLVIYSRMLFPAAISVELSKAGAQPTDFMLDLCLN